MSDEILSPFRRNDFTPRIRKQEKQGNRALKTRFKLFCRKLKNSVQVEYDPDFEDVD